MSKRIQNRKPLVDHLTMMHVSGEPFDATVLDQVRTVDGIRAASASLNRTINLPADFVDHNPARPDRITAPQSSVDPGN